MENNIIIICYYNGKDAWTKWHANRHGCMHGCMGGLTDTRACAWVYAHIHMCAPLILVAAKPFIFVQRTRTHTPSV